MKKINPNNYSNSTGYRFISIIVRDNAVLVFFTYKNKITKYSLAKNSYQEALVKALKERKEVIGIEIPAHINFHKGLSLLSEKLPRERYIRIATKHLPFEKEYVSDNGTFLLYKGEAKKGKMIVSAENKQGSFRLFVITEEEKVYSLGEYFKYSSGLNTKAISLIDIEKIKQDDRFVFCETTYFKLIGYWAVLARSNTTKVKK